MKYQPASQAVYYSYLVETSNFKQTYVHAQNLEDAKKIAHERVSKLNGIIDFIIWCPKQNDVLYTGKNY